MDECRKQFEREIDSFGWSLERTEDGGGYTTTTTEAAWWGWKSAYQAGLREAAKICYDIDRKYEDEDSSAILCMNDILKAAEMVKVFSRLRRGWRPWE